MDGALKIVNAKIVCGDRVITGSLLADHGKIAEICPAGGTEDIQGSWENSGDIRCYDAKGAYLLPGFIELHAHGGFGDDFIDNTPEAFWRILDRHCRHGATTLCPTLVTCAWDRMLSFLTMCEGLRDTPGFGGVHLEGPFLSPQMCGAQNLSLLIRPDERKIAELCERSALIARVTAAPEMGGVRELALALSAKGVKMSVGHSNASAVQMRASADWGFSQVTHLFCSTSQRMKLGSYVHGGIVEEALTNDDFLIELIGDGHHIARESFLMVMRCRGTDAVCVVSDAMRAAGEDIGVQESYLGEIRPENRVILEDGVAKLPDRSSFAGSLACGDSMVRALVGRYGLKLTDVSRMMSHTPAKALGISDRLGSIAPGYDADLVLLDSDLYTDAVFRRGELIYESAGSER